MSAEVLRRAVHDLRIDASAMESPEHEFLHAVADWLDATAKDVDGAEAWNAERDADSEVEWAREPAVLPRVVEALAVARAYLGESS